MSKVKYFIKNNSNPTTIYARFSVSREILLRKSTGLLINPKFFNKKTGKVKNIDEFEAKDELIGVLESLRAHIITSFNKSNSNNESININWITVVINKFFNRHEDNNDITFLVKYTQHYIDKLPTKTNPKGAHGVSSSTLAKYRTILRKVETFESFRKRRFRLKDVDIAFRDDFLRFLLKEDKLSQNTSGRYIKALKTICLDSKKNGYEVSTQLDLVKGFTVKASSIILDFSEIEKIEGAKFEDSKLEIARDWLVLGCFLGQRVSDLLTLTSKDIVIKDNLRLIELIQKKTNKTVSILIHKKVEEILKKYNGDFPPRMSPYYEFNKVIFNKLIKKVAKESGLIEKIYGGKMNPKTNRKEWGIFEKWQLVSSHVCRRSFATNFYGDIPTPLLKSITGHGTEQQFLQYIVKAPIDYAKQLAEYWK